MNAEFVFVFLFICLFFFFFFFFLGTLQRRIQNRVERLRWISFIDEPDSEYASALPQKMVLEVKKITTEATRMILLTSQKF